MSQHTHNALCRAWQPNSEEYGAMRRAVLDFLAARADDGFALPCGKVVLTLGSSPYVANASDAGVRLTIELVELPLPVYGEPGPDMEVKIFKRRDDGEQGGTPA